MESAVIIILAMFAYAPAAHAYLDPGTGSYMFQIIIAGFVGSLFTIKMFWRSMISWVTNLFGKKDYER